MPRSSTQRSSRNTRVRPSRNTGTTPRQRNQSVSDGFGSSALADRVRAVTSSTNRVLESRGSNQRFDTNTGRSYNIDRSVDQTIPAENINNVSAINLPTPTPIQDPGALAYSNNFALSTPENPIDPQTGLFGQQIQSPSQGGVPFNDYGAGLFNDYINAKGAIAPVSQQDIFKQSMKDSGLDKARKEVNRYSSQLNAITTKAQAESLGLEGQGRGITESIIGGQQAQINREAAIQALPIQGQLAAAQGNLELAQQHFSDLFKIRTADAQAQYDYKNKVVDAVYQFATQAQQQRLDELKYNASLARDDKKSNISRQDSYSSMALQNGNPQLAGSIAALDPNDPAFGTKLASKIAQLSTGSGGDRMLTLEESSKYGVPLGTKLSDLSGQILTEGGGSSQRQAITQQTDKLDLLNSIATDDYLTSAVGPSSVSRFDIRSPFTGGKANFISKVDRLTSAETLSSLIALKKAGGALGALSDGEREMLEKSASTIRNWEIRSSENSFFGGKTNGKATVIGYKVKEETFKKELDRLRQLTVKALIESGASPEQSGAVRMPNGAYVIKNYDGTYTQIN